MDDGNGVCCEVIHTEGLGNGSSLGHLHQARPSGAEESLAPLDPPEKTAEKSSMSDSDLPTPVSISTSSWVSEVTTDQLGTPRDEMKQETLTRNAKRPRDSELPTPISISTSSGVNEVTTDQPRDEMKQETVTRKAERPLLGPKGTGHRKLRMSLKKAKMEGKREQESITGEGSDDAISNQVTTRTSQPTRNRRKALSQVSSPSKLTRHNTKSRSKGGRTVVQQLGADAEREPLDQPEAESMLVADAGSTPCPKKGRKLRKQDSRVVDEADFEGLDEEIDCPVASTPQQREARRLARMRQLVEMKTRETVDARRERARKRRREGGDDQSSSEGVSKSPVKRVSWKEECLFSIIDC